jgi:hypothetical protein
MPEMRPKVAELFQYMDTTRAALFDLARNMNPSLSQIRPKSGAWSASENLAHLVLVERSVIRVMTKSIEQARAGGIGPDDSDESFIHSLDKFRVPEPLTRLTAPDRIIPDGSMPVEDSVASLEASRAQLKQIIIDNSDIALTRIMFTHPVLKDLDMYQWALFVPQHEERHRRQMERTLDEVTERAAECAPIV